MVKSKSCTICSALLDPCGIHVHAIPRLQSEKMSTPSLSLSGCACLRHTHCVIFKIQKSGYMAGSPTSFLVLIFLLPRRPGPLSARLHRPPPPLFSQQVLFGLEGQRGALTEVAIPNPLHPVVGKLLHSEAAQSLLRLPVEAHGEHTTPKALPVALAL